MGGGQTEPPVRLARQLGRGSRVATFALSSAVSVYVASVSLAVSILSSISSRDIGEFDGADDGQPLVNGAVDGATGAGESITIADHRLL